MQPPLLEVEVTRDIAAAPRHVWAIITDLEGSKDVISGIDALELLTEGPYDVGTTWHETRRMFGSSATETLTVTAVDPERSTDIEADSNGLHMRSRFVLEPSESGTRLTMRFDGRYTAEASWGWRLVGRLTRGMTLRAMRRTMAQDLDEIAAAAESRAR